MEEQFLIQVEQAIKDSKRKFAVFDFDYTTIHNDIAEAVVHFCCTRCLIKNQNLGPRWINQNQYHEEIFRKYVGFFSNGQPLKAFEFSAQIFAGMRVEEVEKIVIATLQKQGTELGESTYLGFKVNKGIKPRENVVALMDFFSTKDVQPYVVSASPYHLVRVALKYFGIKALPIGVLSMVENQLITEKIIGPITGYEGKVSAITTHIDPSERPIFAIGDSKNDIAMIEYAKVGACVPRSAELVSHAKSKGWFLLE